MKKHKASVNFDKKDELHLKTKDTIEHMDEDTALRLLDLKWIEPLVSGIFELPED
jgi:type I restriction enzyme M protein